MLHSRFVVRMPSDTSLPAEQSHRAARAHKICSDAARQTVDILRSLDKFGLLEQISSDAIHILSLATLFDGESHTAVAVKITHISFRHDKYRHRCGCTRERRFHPVLRLATSLLKHVASCIRSQAFL